MTDRPIIFSAPMIRALLDGRKTQTRRVLKPQPPPFDALFSEAGRWWTGDAETGAVDQVLRVLYTPGDRLWVREAFRGDPGYDNYPPREWSHWPVSYMADPENVRYPHDTGKVRSPIHMPRWASRLTLTVTDVRVQRLQDLTAEDATAEGIAWEADALAPYEWSVSRFADLWNSIHGPEAWDDNPWVAAINFTVRQGNIDA